MSDISLADIAARLLTLWPDIEKDRRSGAFDNVDMYRAISARVFDTQIETVTDRQRALVKEASFGFRHEPSGMQPDAYAELDRHTYANYPALRDHFKRDPS